MTNGNERPDPMEERLGKVEQQVVGLRTDVDALRTDVNGLRQDVDGLREDVDKLRILQEENTTQIKLIAEVQVHHGEILNQLVEDVQPLKVLPDLLRTVIRDHERRITALERQHPQ